jgi:4-hydroxythreonine-4-phosphate dehydrogenase
MIPVRIGITLGDPDGIGPEVVLKALARADLPAEVRIVLYGQEAVLASVERSTGLRLDRKRYPIDESGPGPAPDAPAPGRGPRAGSGAVSFRCFEEAVRAARAGRLEAVVTGPISKTAWGLAGIPWRGHTEYLESLFPGAIMSFWSDRLRLALLSHNLPLREALERAKRGELLRFLRALAKSVDAVRPGAFECIVAGLNPHAGEDGRLGREEIEEIVPAIEAARAEGLRIRGPLPPDVVFRSALDRPQTLAVALTHDQGLIAFKMIAFETGVNVTLGMPFVRASPDHGTAFDIAGGNAADPSSMAAAIRLAIEWTKI